MMLQQFLSAHSVKHPAASIPVRDLHRLFLAAIPVEDRPAWVRGRFTAELAKLGYHVASNGRITLVYGCLLDANLVNQPA